MSCDVCLEEYEQVLKTPLILPCGHTFCRHCLATLKTEGQLLCPMCREQHNVEVEALTINYSLLRTTSPSRDINECPLHKDDLRYWCFSCDLPLCVLCVYSVHPREHTIKLVQNAEEERLELEKKVKGLFSTVENQNAELRNDVSLLDERMKKLFRRNANLRDIKADLDQLLAKVQEANTLTSIKYLEKAVEDFCSEIIISPYGNERLEQTKEDCREEAAATLGPNIPHRQKTFSASSQQDSVTKQVRGAKIEYRDGRLLLHCLAQPESMGLYIQMPSEVFLELSVGEKCLGYVFISLWTNMRVAQQFLSLCQGTVLSLIGMKAYGRVRGTIVFRMGDGGNNSSSSNRQHTTPLSFEDQPTNTLHLQPQRTDRDLSVKLAGITLQPHLHNRSINACFRRRGTNTLLSNFHPLQHQRRGRGICDQLTLMRGNRFSFLRRQRQITNQPQPTLLTNLEWGGASAKHEAEGYVMRMEDNAGLAFGICTTTEKHQHVLAAPFGTVVAGLEVARQAFQCNPLSEVTVTHCGLVLPGLSLLPPQPTDF